MSSVIADYRSLKSYADLLQKKAVQLDSEARKAASNLTKLGHHHQDAVYEQLATTVKLKIQDITIIAQMFQAHSTHLSNLAVPLSEAVRVFFTTVDTVTGTSTQIKLTDVGIITQLMQANDQLYETLQMQVQQAIQQLNQQLATAEGFVRQAEAKSSQANQQFEGAKNALYACENRPAWVDKQGNKHYPNCNGQRSSVRHFRERSIKWEQILGKCRDMCNSMFSEIRNYTSEAQSLLEQMNRYRQELHPLLQAFRRHLETYLSIQSNTSEWTTSHDAIAAATHRTNGHYTREATITTMDLGNNRTQTSHQATTILGDKVKVDYTRSAGSKMYYMKDFTLNGEDVLFKSETDKAKFEINDWSRNGKALKINYIEIPEAYRGQKLGATLVENLEAFARENQCKRLEGLAQDADAKAFFKKLGYHFPNDNMTFEKIL